MVLALGAIWVGAADIAGLRFREAGVSGRKGGGGGGGGGMMMMMLLLMMMFFLRREDVPGRVGEEQDERQATRRVEQRQGP